MHIFTNIHIYIYVEYRCIYVPGIFKGITGPDLLPSPTPVGAEQSILKPHIQFSRGFFFFPKLWILSPHLHSHLQGSSQECLQTLPAFGTGHPDATEPLFNVIQGG